MVINQNSLLTWVIRERLAGTRPPEDFSPRRAHGDLPPGMLPKPPWKRASVLIPLVEREPGHTVLLTRRTDGLQDHGGQVSFPGGSREQTDRDPIETALRETEEETGLARGLIDVVGYLDGYLTITGYAVTPVVGLVQPGFELKPDPVEVAEVFEVPLDWLRDPGNRQVRSRIIAGRDVGFYQFDYEGHVIWGATAAMLVGFIGKLEQWITS
jgi:8-oxo-dGTP pyrophosphatase MutT (NUDIX family)